jgi:hypothetical protein
MVIVTFFMKEKYISVGYGCLQNQIVFKASQLYGEEEEEEEEEELRVGRPGVNEVSFRARPHHNVHRILGVDMGATDPF